MKRLWIVLLLPLLLGTVPVQPIELKPPTPRLGEPLTLSISLPGAGWELNDYPDLTPFQLLEPPHHAAGRIELRLLPLRSGAAQIPGLSLYKGSQIWQSQPLAVDILDPFAEIDTPAPRLPWPTGPAASGDVLLLLAVLFAGFAAGGWLLICRKRKPRPDLLELLGERLARQPGSAQCTVLAEILSGWRFGPYPPTRAELERWEQELAKLEGDGWT